LRVGAAIDPSVAEGERTASFHSLPPHIGHVGNGSTATMP
jgi:hypothetical protein